MPLLPAKRHESDYPEYKYQPVEVKESDIVNKPIFTRQVEWKGMYGYDNAVPEPAEPRRGRGFDETSIIGDQLRCLNSVDEGIGALFLALERNRQLENTIIIYTSDNGMLMGEHGQFHQKRWPYDESIRVPFFIRYPKIIKKGSKRNQLVLNVDLAPTIYELTGIKSLIPLHGRSFLPLLESEAPAWREAFVAEYFHEKVVPRVPAWKTVRTKNWKYIQYDLESEEMNELYDLKNDPKEEINLFHNPEYTFQVEKMKVELSFRELSYIKGGLNAKN